MIPRIIFAATFLCALAAANAVAQEEVEVSFSGRVLAEGRPVNWTLQVRLEREDSSLIDTAHTGGSDSFRFSQVMLRKYEHSYLVIREPEYKELRYPISLDDFFRTSYYNPSLQRELARYYNKTIYILNLEKLPSKAEPGQAQMAGPKSIPVDQILSKKAQKEYDQATEALTSGDNESALKHLEKVVELAPKNYIVAGKLGAEYLKAGHLEKAEAMLIQARSLNSKDLTVLTNLGSLYLQQGDKIAAGAADAESLPGEASYRKAVEVLEEALRLNPQEPRSNYYMGAALYKVGDYEKAEPLLIKALELDKELGEARLALLNLYIRQQDYNAALEQISVYLKAYPDSPQRQQLEKFRAQIENAINP